MADHMKPWVQHWPELSDRGICGKRVRHRVTGSQVPCGKGRDDAIHLFYPCLAEVCARRFWSLESRLEHMEKSHGWRTVTT